MGTVEWSRWKVWIFFLLVVLGSAVVLIPRAEGACTDLIPSGDSDRVIAAFEKEPGETIGAGTTHPELLMAVSLQEWIPMRSTK